MKLDDYFSRAGISHAEFSRKTGISYAFLWQVKKGYRKMPPKYCPMIEEVTGNQVTRRDLRPDDWAEIWPELSDD